jgi:hypothetical protein
MQFSKILYWVRFQSFIEKIKAYMKILSKLLSMHFYWMLFEVVWLLVKFQTTADSAVYSCFITILLQKEKVWPAQTVLQPE